MPKSSLSPRQLPATRAIRLGFGTEAGLISEQLNLPTVVCGPGSIDRAHKADEFITRPELEACDRFLGTVLDQLTA